MQFSMNSGSLDTIVVEVRALRQMGTWSTRQGILRIGALAKKDEHEAALESQMHARESSLQ